jgi:hypothetical protein
MEKIFRVWNGKEYLSNGRGYTLYELTYGNLAPCDYDHIEDLVYEQSTGLFDKDGVEIYENDFLYVPFDWEDCLFPEDSDTEDWELYKSKIKEKYGEYCVYKVELFSGTIGVNCEEYAILSTGFSVRMVYHPEVQKDSDNGDNWGKSKLNQFVGIGQKFSFTNYGTNSDLESNLCKVGEPLKIESVPKIISNPPSWETYCRPDWNFE